MLMVKPPFSMINNGLVEMFPTCQVVLLYDNVINLYQMVTLFYPDCCNIPYGSKYLLRKYLGHS